MSTQWMSLAVGALTAVTTLAAVFLTQWQSGKRESARAKLETDREALRQAREDAARVFDHRRDSYIGFLSSAESSLVSWHEFCERTGGLDHAPDSALDYLWSQLWRVKIYGTVDAAEAAEAVYRWLKDEILGEGNRGKDHAGGFDRLTGELVQQIRRDLGITSELMPSLR